MICHLVEKYLNDMRGPHDGGNASPAALPTVLPASSPAVSLALGIKSSVAGVMQNTRKDWGR